MAFTHKKISTIPDSTDPTLIQGSDWNADHNFNPPSTGVPVSEFINGEYVINGVSASKHFQMLRRSKDVKNITYEFADTANIVISTDYIFTPIVGSVALTASIANTFVFANGVPLGINSSNQGHYIRIVDPTGGSENVLITGGTASSGSSTGTITFTPALNHAIGAYTIQTATSGISEAFNSTAGPVSVFVPTGEHLIYATITFNKPNSTIYGNGSCSALVAGNNSVQMIKILPTPASAWMYFNIHDLKFDGSAYSTNTITAINVTEVALGFLTNLVFDNTHYGLYLNRIWNCLISDIQALDNTTCFFGSDSDTSNNTLGTTLSFGIMVVNFSHWNKSFYPDPTHPYSITEVLKIQRCAGIEFQNVRTFNLYGIEFCRVSGHNEGVVFDGGLIGGGTVAFRLRELTSGPVTGRPVHMSIRNMDIDLFYERFVDIGGNCSYISITNCRITGTHTTPDYVIIAATGSRAIEVRGCVFQNHKSGVVIQMSGGVLDFYITENMFSNQLVGVGASSIVIGPNCDYYVISRNIKASDDTSPSYINVITPVGANREVEDNLGHNDIHGGDLSPANTLNLIYSYYNITGSGSIQIINRPHQTGPLYLFPAPGATWTLLTGGNIGKASTAIAGATMTLIWNRNTNQWNPSY